jgi:hypothetical protein
MASSIACMRASSFCKPRRSARVRFVDLLEAIGDVFELTASYAASRRRFPSRYTDCSRLSLAIRSDPSRHRNRARGRVRSGGVRLRPDSLDVWHVGRVCRFPVRPIAGTPAPSPILCASAAPMRQRGLNHFARVVMLILRPRLERRAKAVNRYAGIEIFEHVAHRHVRQRPASHAGQPPSAPRRHRILGLRERRDVEVNTMIASRSIGGDRPYRAGQVDLALPTAAPRRGRAQA